MVISSTAHTQRSPSREVAAATAMTPNPVTAAAIRSTTAARSRAERCVAPSVFMTSGGRLPTGSNGTLGHLRQVVRDLIPWRLELDVDVLVRPDERVIIEGASRYLENGLLGFRRVWHL